MAHRRYLTGKRNPEPKRVTFCYPPDDFRRMKKFLRRSKIAMSSFIRGLIANAVNQEDLPGTTAGRKQAESLRA